MKNKIDKAVRIDAFHSDALQRLTCLYCVKTAHAVDDIPKKTGADGFLVAVPASGSARINGKNGVLTLTPETFSFFCDDNITICNITESTEIFFAAFSGSIADLTSELALDCGMRYEMTSEFYELFEKILRDYCDGVELGGSLLFTSTVYELLTRLSRRIHAFGLPASLVGVDGFSVDNIALREYGTFHGKSCVKISPNVDKNGLIVLENYNLWSLRINPLLYGCMQMKYYYESKGMGFASARLRVLNCIEEENANEPCMHDYRNIHFGSDGDFYAPLRRNRWSSAFFKINYSPNALAVLNSMRKPLLRQIKIDPFGVVDSQSLDADDKMYIQSIAFYSSLPTTDAASVRTPLEDVRLLMDKNFRNDFPISYYSDFCHMTVGHFTKSFHEKYGLPPHKYILNRRIEYAKLYIDKSYPIEKLAFELGFSDAHYFSRIFRKYTGFSPTEWLRIKGGEQ